ncbi:MAG: nuoH [Dehalococcoidia bacterium]|nr:nuoH [Dehalococcoidia bacterium]
MPWNWFDRPLPADWPGGYWWHLLVFAVFIVGLTLTMVMIFIYLERRGVARFQIRPGPNRCGPFGIMQPMADAIKVLFKEDIVPDKADGVLHWLAPVVAFFPALLILAVVPFHNGAALVDLDIGILYVIAVSSISTLGVVMAGWSSNNKYSLIAAIRAIAQTVSYELPMVLSIIGVIVLTGSLSLNDIVARQSVPFIFFQPLGFLIFLIGLMAEMNRSPFDLMEAESEIVAGFHTEYSSMKQALFYLAEYAHAFGGAAIISTLFLGGWKGPILPPLVWLLLKTVLVFAIMFWARATLPRVRIDQFMGFLWKGLLPLALINLFFTAAEVLVWPDGLPLALIPINFVAAGFLIVVWSGLIKFGGGRVAVQ